ncbi:methylenetetrahydrofolate reduct [Pluteus cervinus]|uniref:Methylenetetrahydrofolate reduct n=1 Tax=Pluteus cervinus TaxID=181527 RepID=A0ACD3BEE9_9AGAR|nr:methylenetetrahydrofolate reduct [Pluteus cervinus]
MKLTQSIAGRDPRRPFYTFEFFPPRTDQGFENLLPRIARLAELQPLAISITWGAGGTTKERTLELAGVTQAGYGLDSILHLTCTNMEQGMVDDALKLAKDRGVQNILALRGDPPRGSEEWIATDSRFQNAKDLVSYIRSSPEHSSQFCVGVAGYPDGHAESLVDEDTEIEYLKQKVDAGADFIITQLFYDVDRFLVWLKKVRAKGITVPVIPGVMPIQTYSSFLRLVKLCGVRVPPKVMEDLQPISHDDQLIKNYGVSLAVEMISRMVGEGAVSGVHFCTLNLEKSVSRILENLGWTGIFAQLHNKLIAGPREFRLQPPPNHTVSEFLVTPATATNNATYGLVNIPSNEYEAGKGELNNAASWDDFPNGRFGDFKSPAYGDQAPYGGPGILASAPAKQWGNPKTLEDLTNMFLDYLHSKIATTPFSQAPLSPESVVVLSHLEKLTRRGWWTVGSQPAIDAARSDDPVVGWGPRAGRVFQKGFVEFFCKAEDIALLARKMEKAGHDWTHWFAGNHAGDFRTNVPEGGRNAVTWGVFPGQEIVQTTIIEKESFLAWKEEAFSIWSDWGSFYHPDSKEREVINRVHNERWLVSIVHHDYKDPEALWTFLSEDLD